MANSIVYVDLRQLTGLYFDDTNSEHGDNCPTTPIAADRVSFDMTQAEQLDRGLPLILRIERLKPGRYAGPKIVRSSPNARREFADGGTIDDISEFSPNKPTGKLYRLQNPSGSNDVVDPPFEIACAGEAGKGAGRNCHTTYTYQSEFIVYYDTRMDIRAIPGRRWPTTNGALLEPDGLVALDRRVREFIEDLKKRP